jgi:diguanylate cyclase (GGDEF)-like protein/PAS domain S-box-containing protein
MRLPSGLFGRLSAPWSALAMLLLALAGFIGVDLHASRAAIEAQERVRLQQMAAMVEANLSSRLQSTSNALDSIRHDWSDRWLPQQDMSLLNQRLQSMVAAMSGVRSVTVVSREGDVIASNRLEFIGQNVHQAERYQAMRQGRDPSLLYVSTPFLSLTGVYSLAVGKVVLDARGELLGYVSAVLDPDYFSVLLESVLYAPDLRAALIHSDGQGIFRVPDAEKVAGLDFVKTPNTLFMRHLESGQKTSMQEGVTASTGQHRLVVLSSIQPTATRSSKSLVISISRQVPAIYRDWERELWIKLALFGALAAVASLGLLAIQWRQRAYAQLRRSHEAESLQAGARLRESEERFRKLFEDTVQAVLLFENGRCVAANKAALALHGMQRLDQWIGRTLSEHAPPLQPDGQPSVEKAAALAQRALEQGACECEWTFLRPDGQGFVAHLVVTLIHQGGQALLHIAGTDITEQKRAREQVEFLAYHDALTGLPNRVLGRNRLQQALEVAQRQRNGLAVLYLDLDKFKYVNDSYGHAVGDALLKGVATRLALCLRAEDTVCRLSGDEFMVVLPDLGSCQQAADLCARILSELGDPFDLEGVQLFTSFSIGVALHPQDGSDSETLMLNADTALYEAKKAGHNLYRVFEPSMNVKLLHYVETCDALRLALEQQQFELHYQPQIDLRSGQVLGVEALIRWRRPGHGLVQPGDFIGIAEESGLIVPIGRWVLHEACRQAAQWQRAGLRPGRMAVNLSAAQFRQGVVERDVRSALEASGLDPAGLELELTESILLQHDEPVMATLAHWSARGIRLAIDDFGTGYSSLAYLKRMQVDRLKIDRSFITGLLQQDENQAIVRAMIQIARSLQLDTLAEGIEDPLVAEHLKVLGCDGVQGFCYSEPLPAAGLEQWLQRRAA